MAFIMNASASNMAGGVRNLLYPFDQSSAATLRASSRKVFAHWHNYPISIEDTSPGTTWPGADYYGQVYMDPADFPSFGGIMRDRPLPRAHIGTPFILEDMKTEVRNAIDMGIDGFMYNIFLLSPDIHWQYFTDLLDAAAAVDTGFKIIPNIDCLIRPGTEAATIATAINTVISHSSIYRLPDTRPVISTFGAEFWTLAQHTTLKTNVTGCAYMPIFQGTFDTAKIPSGSYGTGEWGSADAAGTGGTAAHATTAHGLGLIWVEPVRPQFDTPNGNGTTGMYWECAQTNMMRQMWTQAIINSAEWVQLATWNDYGEAAHVCPATGTQYGIFDICAFFTQLYKDLAVPTVTRDVLIYMHRIMPPTATYNTATQTGGAFSFQGGTTVQDNLECYAFLVTPGDIEIELQGTTTTFSAVAAGNNGMSVAVGGRVGKPIFTLKRSGVTIKTVTSAFTIRNSTTGPQDFYYRAGGTNRSPVTLVNDPTY